MTEFKVLTAEEQVAAALAADARRLRGLTGLALFMWLQPAAVLIGLLWLQPGGPAGGWSPTGAAAGGSDPLERKLTVLTAMTGLLSVAGPTTVLLLNASRRATLRQIQASLAAIAGQLAEVQRGRGTMPPTAGG